MSLTGGEQGRASEKGSCQGPVSLDKSEVSILHRQHGILVVWGAGGALEESPGPQAIKFSVIRTGPSVAAVTYMDPEMIQR